MKRTFALILALSLAVLPLFLAGCGKAEHPKTLDDLIKSGIIRVGVSASVPGFSSYNENINQYEGFEIDIAFAITQKIFNCGYDEAKERLMFVPVEPENRIKYLEEDKVDIIIAALMPNEQNRKKASFSAPYFTPDIGFAVTNGKVIRSPADLEGMTIGIAEGMKTDSVICTYLRESGHDMAGRITFANIDAVRFYAYIASLGTGETPSGDETMSGFDALAAENKRFSETAKGSHGYFNLTASACAFAAAAPKGSDETIGVIDAVLRELEQSGLLDGLQILWGLKWGAIKYD